MKKRKRLGHEEVKYEIMAKKVLEQQELAEEHKQLYTDIAALAKKTGYCLELNSHFTSIYNTSTDGIKNRIANLKNHGFLKDIGNNRQRVLVVVTDEKEAEAIKAEALKAKAIKAEAKAKAKAEAQPDDCLKLTTENKTNANNIARMVFLQEVRKYHAHCVETLSTEIEQLNGQTNMKGN